jgi:hypothetical protein
MRLNTVIKWRDRFKEHPLSGLKDAERDGRLSIYGKECLQQAPAVIDREPPKGSTVWEGKSIAKERDEWLKTHPNLQFHYTPTSASWSNMVEIRFNITTRKVLKHGTLDSNEVLTKKIKGYIEAVNGKVHPFIWRKRDEKGSQTHNTIASLRNNSQHSYIQIASCFYCYFSCTLKLDLPSRITGTASTALGIIGFLQYSMFQDAETHAAAASSAVTADRCPHCAINRQINQWRRKNRNLYPTPPGI